MNGYYTILYNKFIYLWPCRAGGSFSKAAATGRQAQVGRSRLRYRQTNAPPPSVCHRSVTRLDRAREWGRPRGVASVARGPSRLTPPHSQQGSEARATGADGADALDCGEFCSGTCAPMLVALMLHASTRKDTAWEDAFGIPPDNARCVRHRPGKSTVCNQRRSFSSPSRGRSAPKRARAQRCARRSRYV
jgi:hypothetical protein